MALAPVRLDVLEPLDVAADDALELALYHVVLVDDFLDAGYLAVRQVFDARGGLDLGPAKDVVGALGADAVYISKRYQTCFSAGMVTPEILAAIYQPCLCLCLGLNLLIT